MSVDKRWLALAIFCVLAMIMLLFSIRISPAHARGCWRHVYHNPHRFIGIRYYPEIGYAYRLSYRPPFYPPGELR